MTLSPAPSMLIVDDDVDFVRAAADIARAEGFGITVAGTVGQALGRLKGERFDLALIDLSLPDGSGMELVEACDTAAMQLVLITGKPTLESALRAVRTCVNDYVVKPLDPAHYCELLRATASRRRVPSSPPSTSQRGLVGSSPALQQIVRQIERVGPTDVSVLVEGESGVGKELVARAIHEASGSSGPFVAINCGALPAELLASALFGHERGSFTGAATRHLGYFEQAAGGTLFLDEITEMPLHLQVHLLRALEARTIRRVGGTDELAVDVRIVAATNRQPLDAVRDGMLREDLYYRLGEFPLAVPPLRDRREDILPLASLFLARLNERHGTHKSFTLAAVEQLERHHWPGNVRELRNVVNRAYILCEDDAIQDPLAIPHLPQRVDDSPTTLTLDVGMTLEEMERRMLLKTLRHFGNEKARAAAALGISVKTIYNRLVRWKEQDATGDGSREIG